jgi:hypothetical protein
MFAAKKLLRAVGDILLPVFNQVHLRPVKKATTLTEDRKNFVPRQGHEVFRDFQSRFIVSILGNQFI